MLSTLELRDFAIVERLQLDLEPGLNVLTGETGAGKSILVDALSLLTGARPDTTMIRAGSESALVQGVFDGLAIGSAARTLQRNGRHHARIDGELVSVTELADRGSEVLGIFAQHAALELSSGARQRAQLDRLLTEPERRRLADHRAAFARLQQLEEELRASRAAADERARRLELLTFQVDEIRSVAPRPGELAALRTELRSLQHAERILQAAGRAQAGLAGDGGGESEGAAAQAGRSLRELREASRFDPQLAALAEDLDQAVNALNAVATELEGFVADFRADPARLETVRTRLDKLESLGAKYGAPSLPSDGRQGATEPSADDGVLAYLAKAEAERDELGRIEADLATWESERSTLERALEASAVQLRAARRHAAAELRRHLLPSLRELGMQDARFEVEITPAGAMGPSGRDEVRFMLGSNPGEPLAPVATAASGGELSRIMLALHMVTGSSLPVLVFDEVDAGIGGATARAVGAMLRRLARRHQVLVVTHLPQVAAAADVQYLVRKEQVEGRTRTTVLRLTPEERTVELARMLSGSVTDVSMRHASELLEDATADPTRGQGGMPGEPTTDA